MMTRAALILALPLLPRTAGALFDAPTASPEPPAAKSAFILDPGHGGQDLGAVVGGKHEKDIALAIARKVTEKLEALAGAKVRLTRDSDTYLPLDQRVGDGVEWEGAAFVSLHLNKVRYKQLHGITVYAFGAHHMRGGSQRLHHLAPMPAPPKEEALASRALAAALVRSLRAQGFRVAAPERAAFYVLKNPSIPSVLIELGYLSNPSEAARLNDPAYQDRLAEALAVSLRSYSATAAAGLARGSTPSGR